MDFDFLLQLYENDVSIKKSAKKNVCRKWRAKEIAKYVRKCLIFGHAKRPNNFTLKIPRRRPEEIK